MADQPDGKTEVLTVSPATPLSTASVSSINRKRRITPSSEASASKKCYIVSSPDLIPSNKNTFNLGLSPAFSPSKKLFPAGEAHIGEFYSSTNIYPRCILTPSSLDERFTIKTTHAHPEPEEPGLDSQEAAVEHWSPRHVILPFNLRNNPKDFHNPENRKLLWKIFPQLDILSFDGHFLCFCVKALPPKPWPRTVAGVPAYLTTDRNDDGPIPPIKRTSQSLIKLAKDIDCRDDNTKIDQVFNILKAYFTQLRVSITQLQYWENFVVVVLEDRSTDMTKVPRAAARCPCYYLFDDELGRPENLSAKRIKEPTGDVVDDSLYETLRPGVMLSSGRPSEQAVELRTTSGVLVKDSLGNQYMTAASHGFPFGTKVYHPVAEAKEVGELIMELTHTDVGLVRLHDGVQFINHTFENTLLEADSVQLKGFTGALDRSMKYGDSVYMNSPWTGYGEGTYGPYVEDRIPRDDPFEPKQVWIQTRWLYLGQGFSHQAVDGACGSAIWNDDGNVLGFFGYAPASGQFLDWCLAVSVDHLVDRGFTIV